MFAIYFDMVSLVFSHVFSPWTEPGPMSLIGGTRVDVPLASGSSGCFPHGWATSDSGHNDNIFSLVKMRHHENRLRPNEIW